jgi:hypothetical protein
MIRADKAIKGIPIPGPDGVLATHATRLASKGDTLTDPGLVDDTMIALWPRESILPLLRVLDRFEAMSNHRMNISKTMMLLLGHERDFELAAPTSQPPAPYGAAASREPTTSPPGGTTAYRINGMASS